MLAVNAGKNMNASHSQDQTPSANSEYEDRLAQAIARNDELRQENDELQQELKRLTSSWEAERSQLKTRIVQLEHSLVDAIERSNNPLRTALVSDEKLRLVEEVKRQWNAQWEAERNRLLDELNRLRSSFEQTPGLKTDVSEVRDGKAHVTSK